jgi:catechol 2,3-dioxygenase-like lactoylglutathione lyase family enzyme
MSLQQKPATVGFDHIGLSVRNLDLTRQFFCDPIILLPLSPTVIR